MPRQLEGSRAVAEAVALCRPEVICAYPISPQTHIVEGLSAIVKSARLGSCEFVNVESEFAAMSASIGASATGARSYTATASQGLLYMAEALYNASGLGLPIVMTVSLLCALFVAMTFVPLLGYYIQRAPSKPEPTIEERRERGFYGFYNRLVGRAYPPSTSASAPTFPT